jgi:phosphomannomutase
MVRYSGTEPKIRIMVESIDKIKAERSAKTIEKTVKEIDKFN